MEEFSENSLGKQECMLTADRGLNVTNILKEFSVLGRGRKQSDLNSVDVSINLRVLQLMRKDFNVTMTSTAYKTLTVPLLMQGNLLMPE